jgi:hypothetical protein
MKLLKFDVGCQSAVSAKHQNIAQSDSASVVAFEIAHKTFGHKWPTHSLEKVSGEQEIG